MPSTRDTLPRKAPLALARRLRCEMTDAERRLWQGLRQRQIAGARFRRQHRLGVYIVDFVCLERHLIVEVDGGQHLDSQHDQVRDQWLTARGYRVLRFWNHDVLRKTAEVLDEIWRCVR